VLTHKEELTGLATQAERHAAEGHQAEQRQTLEQMLRLLPSASKQHAQLQEQLLALPKSRKKVAWGKLGWLGAVGLLLWKSKVVIAFVLGKGKLLLLGLTKTKTLLSMLLSLGLYWTVWGWQFALGFILSIYVHEIGHVAALRKHGIPASAPMFVPFLGAFVRMKDYPKSPSEDASVGLAGPLYGLGAAVFCYLVFLTTDASLFGAIARAGAWINLFNLLPVWQLDGGRGFNALTQQQRWLATAVLGGAFLFTGDGLLILLVLAAAYRSALTSAPSKPDWVALATYAGLVASLSAVSRIPLPGLPN
jgi:Zn-dependent protease